MIRNCLARVGCLALLVLLAAAVWFFRDDVTRALGRLDVGKGSQPSEQLARRAEAKLEELGRPGAGETSFSEAELQSLLTYSVAPLLPPGVARPVVELRDSSLVVSAFVRPDSLGRYAPPEALRSIVTDSARVAVELVPGIFRPGVGRLRVAGLDVGGVPVPTLMVPFLLQNVEIPGVQPAGTMLLFAVPDGVGQLRVEPGALVVDEGDASD